MSSSCPTNRGFCASLLALVMARLTDCNHSPLLNREDDDRSKIRPLSLLLFHFPRCLHLALSIFPPLIFSLLGFCHRLIAFDLLISSSCRQTRRSYSTERDGTLTSSFVIKTLSFSSKLFVFAYLSRTSRRCPDSPAKIHLKKKQQKQIRSGGLLSSLPLAADIWR